MSVYNNTVILKGNVCKEAEIKETTAGSVAKFTLAVYRTGKGNEAVTDFLIVSCWHDLCRGMSQINKGTSLIVIGSVITRSYEAKDGTKRYVTEIQAREIGLDIAIKKEGSKEEPEESPF